MRINTAVAGYHFAVSNGTQNCGSLFSGVLEDGTPMIGQMSLFYKVGDMESCTGWEWNGTPSSFDPDEGQEAIDACHDAWLEALDGPIGKLIENGWRRNPSAPGLPING